MGKKLIPKDSELYGRIDEVLHYIWDPIGISDEPWARDEYHTYLPEVFSLIKSNSSIDKIVDYLVRIEHERMGLTPNREHAKIVAEILVAWQQRVSEENR
ncbi:MAG: hypothetical protein KGZ93_10365 [Actinobacteria bacterium]|nr:hypothetical protein [Actinomycetota bacterium]